jgi:hypothetical protein
MPRKKKPAQELIETRHLAQIGRDPHGNPQFVGQGSYALRDVVTVDVGKPFEHKIRVPGPSGLVIEGLDNREPWSPGQMLTGARLGWFGFKTGSLAPRPEEISTSAIGLDGPPGFFVTPRAATLVADAHGRGVISGRHRSGCFYPRCWRGSELDT